ncbi:hypothetical protein [Rhodanobacter sp. DHG33]|uniref:hypothetical protein n=1 Tax=Rhodanobacter sp. DHG33 TaxID=2775921 RepID=UPI0017861F9E|nr:hypothetical protein [Rhodanobacter sp. DHG33]MBD8898655.1 hypothetical protein [Rhodanobacter sp. DHG33]
MKLGALKSVGHNVAHSLASGVGFLIGVYGTDVFAEAAADEPGFIVIDFLAATASGNRASPGLLKAIGLYRAALPEFCEKHGVDHALIKTLSARFGTDPAYGPHFTVTVEDVDGRKSVDQYIGFDGRHLRTLATEKPVLAAKI